MMKRFLFCIALAVYPTNAFQTPLPKNGLVHSALSTRTQLANNSNNSGTTVAKIAKFLFQEITEDINALTGKEKWEPGDLLRWMDKSEYKYKFGDLTKWATGFATKQAAEYVGLEPDKLDIASFVSKVRSGGYDTCLLYTSPSPRDRTRSRMPSSA